MLSSRRSANPTGHRAGSWLLPSILRWTVLERGSMVAAYAGSPVSGPARPDVPAPGLVLGRSAGRASPGPGARSVHPRRPSHSLIALVPTDPVSGRGGPPVGPIS